MEVPGGDRLNMKGKMVTMGSFSISAMADFDENRWKFQSGRISPPKSTKSAGRRSVSGTWCPAGGRWPERGGDVTEDRGRRCSNILIDYIIYYIT